MGTAGHPETYADGLVEPFGRACKSRWIQGIHDFGKAKGEDGVCAKTSISLPTSDQHGRVMGVQHTCKTGCLVEDGNQADFASDESPFLSKCGRLCSGYGAPGNDRKLQARGSGDAED